MFELALEEGALHATVERGPGLVRLVMPPTMNLLDAMSQVAEDLFDAMVTELTDIFGSSLCVREFQLEKSRLIIRRAGFPRPPDGIC